MTKNTVEISLLEFHRIKNALEEMQGGVFFHQDGKGRLRRWYPPAPFREPSAEGKEQ